jgi:hypothetical protein
LLSNGNPNQKAPAEVADWKLDALYPKKYEAYENNGCNKRVFLIFAMRRTQDVGGKKRRGKKEKKKKKGAAVRTALLEEGKVTDERKIQPEGPQVCSL